MSCKGCRNLCGPYPNERKDILPQILVSFKGKESDNRIWFCQLSSYEFGGGEAKANKLPHSGRQEEGLLLLSFTETTSRSKCVQNTVANVPGDQHLGELARISI